MRGILTLCSQMSVALTVVVTTAGAQVVQIRPIDVLAGINDHSVRLMISPPAGNDSLNPFDGNPNSDLFMNGVDSLSITLLSDTPIQVRASTIFSMDIGAWSLEAADTLPDLDSRTGSYALLVDNRSYAYRVLDSAAFPQTSAKAIRLTVRDVTYHFIDLGEWTLMNSVTFTNLVIIPYPARLIPGAQLKVRVNMQDSNGRIYPYSLRNPVDWSTDDAGVATADANGVLTGVALGATRVHAATEPPLLTGSAPVTVENDFVSEKAAAMTVKVALLLIDPPLPDYGYERMHVKYRWHDPVVLSNGLVSHFLQSTDSVVNFVIDTVFDASRLFTRMYGSFPSVTQFETYLNEPGWVTLKAAADSGQLWFDYRYCVNYYHLDSLRNNGRIDEVWVYAAPYMGMYESQLMGPTAFWWNSPPIRDGTGLRKLLSVMGLNYERGVDLGFHSFGHRFESAMIQAYMEAQGRPWNDTSANPTPWDLFTRINKDVPGGAHVGNTHFPPNGTHDYDYGNTTLVTSYAQNWFRYPYLFNGSTQVNVSTWLYTPPDPQAEGQDQLGYLAWMYNHVPRYTGISDGVLNNWWAYFLDYDKAVAEAKGTPVLSVTEGTPARKPSAITLEQNYPNPFNPSTAISYELSAAGAVTLTVFDILGRQVATLVDGVKAPGRYTATWNGSQYASGVYFCRLKAPGFVQTRKMILLK